MKRLLFGLLVVIGVLAGLFETARADIKRFVRMDAGVYRGDQPDTLEDYKRLAELGVKTIVNLRNDETFYKEIFFANQVGIKVLHFPMSTFTWPNNETVEKVLNTLSDKAQQPVFVHCQYGKDRTGLISALYRVHVQGWKKSSAYKEMLHWGFSPLLVNFQAYFVAATFDAN